MSSSPLTIGFLTILGTLFLTSWYKRFRDEKAKLDAIPTIGYAGPISSYYSAFEFVRRGAEIIEEGYKKFPGKAFKIALPDRWLVIVTGQRLIEDIRKAPGDMLSFTAAIEEFFQTSITVGKIIRDDPWHVDVIKGPLTKNIAGTFGEMYDEITRAFGDEFGVDDHWIKVPAQQKARRIVCRVTNRVFLGEFMCQNEEWIRLVMNFTKEVNMTAGLLVITPKCLQSFVGWLMAPRRRYLKRSLELLKPVILERQEALKNGNVNVGDLPDDFLTWLLKEANTAERADPTNIATAMLSTNAAALQTTTMAFTNALFDLAARPELVPTLRREVEEVIREDGWAKAAMGNMRILDSFLKESQRISNTNAFGLLRKPLQDFVFSDGTIVPKGTFIATAPRALHFDKTHYTNPDEFDGLRFYYLREQAGDNLKCQMVTPGDNYLSFGLGKQACPGRFFAVNVLKALVSYVILNYDIKFDQGDKSKLQEYAGRVSADPNTQIMLRKRDSASI